MIQVIHRGLDLLELISQDRSRLYTLAEISGTLNLNKGTCANIIKTLVTRGYLKQEGRMTGYRLGSMSYLLAGNYSHKQELLSAATELMNKLSDTLNENCLLSILKDNNRIVLLEMKTTHELQVINRIEKEAYISATGRVILACMDDKEQNQFILRFGLPSPDAWPGIEDKEDLITELHKINKKQLATHVSTTQIIGWAVPIYKDKKAIAGLGLYLPQSRNKSSLQQKFIEELRKTAEEINENLNQNIHSHNSD